jgi:hypothetical protein
MVDGSAPPGVTPAARLCWAARPGAGAAAADVAEAAGFEGEVVGVTGDAGPAYDRPARLGSNQRPLASQTAQRSRDPLMCGPRPRCEFSGPPTLSCRVRPGRVVPAKCLLKATFRWARRVSNLRPLACEAWSSLPLQAQKCLQIRPNGGADWCSALGPIRPSTAGFGPTNGPTARSARGTRRRQIAPATSTIAAAHIREAARRVVATGRARRLRRGGALSGQLDASSPAGSQRRMIAGPLDYDVADQRQQESRELAVLASKGRMNAAPESYARLCGFAGVRRIPGGCRGARRAFPA